MLIETIVMAKRKATALEFTGTTYPFRWPKDEARFQRLISLLGHRTKGELKNKARQELIGLIGSYPSAEQAAFWKKNLKTLERQQKQSLIQ